MDGVYSEDDREWLEQIEEVAGPLWQHWDGEHRTCLTPACAGLENTVTRCHDLNVDVKTELAVACRTLNSTACRESETANCSITLDTEKATDSLQGLCFSAFDSGPTTGLYMDHCHIPGAAGHRSPVGSCTETDTCLEGWIRVCGRADGTTRAAEGLVCLRGDAQWRTEAVLTDGTDSGSCVAQKESHANAQDNLCYPKLDHSVTLDVMENLDHVLRSTYSTARCGIDSVTDLQEKNEDEESVDSHWGSKMHEVDQDPLDFGDLPDDISEFMNDDYLLGADVFFGDSWLNFEEFGNFSDVAVTTDLPSPDSSPRRQTNELFHSKNNQRKRQRVTRTQRCADENTPSRPKRQRAAAKPQTTDAQDEPTVCQLTDEGTKPSTAKTADVTTTPPRIVHLHPAIQVITIPDAPGYQVIQTLGLSPPVIRLPLPNTAATPTYILVPSASPTRKQQVQPLSPVDGAVVPVRMSSSPPGSLSDTASRAMSHHRNSRHYPTNNMSPCKESPLPHSPTVLDIPQVVKEYIQEVKAYMSRICPDIEEGLSLTSHYVDMQVSRRESLRSGKSTNKGLEKELIIMGDTDRRNSLLGHHQIFRDSNAENSKRYILLFGNAGMGKTTLVRKICLDWSRDCIPQFDFVFLLDGKALTLPEPVYSLQTLLLNLSSFAPPCMDPEAVYAQILAATKRVLIIFDGFDTLRDYEILLQTQEKDLVSSLQKDNKAEVYTVRQLYSAILQRVLLPGCTLLLTARPTGTASQLLRRIDSFLELRGFTPTDVETYLSQYFTDPAQRTSALDCLRRCSYLRLLCWNPGLCRLVCLLLEQSRTLDVLPRTLTGLCHQVFRVTMERDRRDMHSRTEGQTQTSQQLEEETQTLISSDNNNQTKSEPKVQLITRTHTRNTQRVKGAKKQKNQTDKTDQKDIKGRVEVDGKEERELLSQLSSLAWEGVKANSSILSSGKNLSGRLKAYGLRTRLFVSLPLRRKLAFSSAGTEGGGEDKDKGGEREEQNMKGNKGRMDIRNLDASDNHIMSWTNPFLQSYLAGVHLSLSRTVSDRTFLQSLPFQSGPKGRRRPQREELELTQQFAVGLLFHNVTELQRLHSYTETFFRNMVSSKQALVIKHLEGLSLTDLSPSHVLEACHYVYEACFTCDDGNRGGCSTQLVSQLAAKLPEVLSFHGVPLNPPDVFAVQNVLESGVAEGRTFCLDLEDSGIQVSGLRALVGLNNISTYRACIADVITLWEQLEQSGEEVLLRGAVSKFKIHPLKITQVCHVEHLAKLVNIHLNKRLSDSCTPSNCILAEGVPAVRELHKLEFELGPEKGPLGLPKLWELLPGLDNLQHLDLENSKIGDKGSEKLADALASLCSLEIINLSQNCIGDQGLKKLTSTLRDQPKLHCLSLYSNVISDEGAESLAAVLPHMVSLTDLDVKYNKLTDVGAQSLGASLRNCRKIKSLRMWNQCIPYGVFERLQQQDSRILWH